MRTLELLPRDGDQLELDLGEPWRGISPRYLTQAHARFSLPHDGAPPPSAPRPDGNQLTLFPEEKSLWHVDALVHRTGPAIAG